MQAEELTVIDYRRWACAGFSLMQPADNKQHRRGGEYRLCHGRSPHPVPVFAGASDIGNKEHVDASCGSRLFGPQRTSETAT